MKQARILEIVGQMIVGDAVTCLIVPRRHMLLWRDALPWPWWRRMTQWLADSPRVTMAAGLVEGVIGVGLIVRASRGSSRV